MKWVWLLCIVLLSVSVSAEIITEKQITLLAVSQEGEGELRGGVADLNLELRDGEGRIFIDTFPLTKIDTQISARLAKEIACDFAQVDCNQYDFVYTIRSNSPTIGGPSAGAAISGITVAALLNLDVSSKVALTGTIGSGGLVGPVGGVEPKVKAAARNGIDTVLIPLGQRFTQNTTNQTNESINTTIDVADTGAKLGVEVIEVATIYEVVRAISGFDKKINDTQVQVPDYYIDTMKSLSDQLCARAQEKRQLSQQYTYQGNATNISQVLNRAQELINNSNQASEQGQNYAAASFCFGAALQYNYAFWITQDKVAIENGIDQVQQLIVDFDRPDINTQTELQTAMLVEERLVETQELLNDAQTAFIENRTEDAAFHLSYAEERYYSAVSWSAFFDVDGKQVSLDEDILNQACRIRLSEAEQRQQYVGIYIPFTNELETEDLDRAYSYQAQNNNVMCIFFASKAKAYFDVLISSLGASDDGLQKQLNARFNVAQYNIGQQLSEGIFPIAAFSYAEYGKSLIGGDLFSAVLYLQYAIELSDIGIYLNAPESNSVVIQNDDFLYLDEPQDTFLAGLALGLCLGLLAFRFEKWMIFRRRK